MPGCRPKQFLDLTREHVLAARHDHVVIATIDEEQPVVEMAEVAGREQAAPFLLAAAGRVPVEPHRSADEDPADRSIGQWFTLIVEDLDLHPEGHPPGGGRRGRRSSGVATVAIATSVEP